MEEDKNEWREDDESETGRDESGSPARRSTDELMIQIVKAIPKIINALNR